MEQQARNYEVRILCGDCRAREQVAGIAVWLPSGAWGIVENQTSRYRSSGGELRRYRLGHDLSLEAAVDAHYAPATKHLRCAQGHHIAARRDTLTAAASEAATQGRDAFCIDSHATVVATSASPTVPTLERQTPSTVRPLPFRPAPPARA